MAPLRVLLLLAGLALACGAIIQSGPTPAKPKGRAAAPRPRENFAALRRKGGFALSKNAMAKLDDSEEENLTCLGISTRAAWLALVWALPLLLAPLGALIRPFRTLVWYRLLAFALAKSGAAFIKWGQWAAVRPDMFPLQLCTVLSHLHSDAPRHSWEHTYNTLKETLGGDPMDFFDNIKKDAIASGSIAQVHVAYVEGHKVAVKVRHPRVRRQIALDFHIMKAVARFVSHVPGLSWLNLEASMEQFSDTIAGQTRLDIEGDNLDRFVSNFKNQRRWCGFPRVILKSPAVLVESFEEGQLASKFIQPFRDFRDYRAGKKPQPSKRGLFSSMCSSLLCCLPRCVGGRSGEEEWEEGDYVDLSLGQVVVSRGSDMYLQMLLRDNLMHADLHPGNILVQSKQAQMDPDEDDDERVPESGRETRIVLVDAGMVARLQRKEQRNFIGFLQAMGDGDGWRGGICVLGFSDKQSCSSQKDRDAFCQAMQVIFKEHCKGYGTGVSVGQVLIEVLQCIRLHKVRIDVNYATLVINVLCLHGLAEALQPDYNILDAAQPLLKVYKANAVWEVAVQKFIFPVAQAVKRVCDGKAYNSLRREMMRERGHVDQNLAQFVLSQMGPVTLTIAAAAAVAIPPLLEGPGPMLPGGGGGESGGKLLKDREGNQRQPTRGRRWPPAEVLLHAAKRIVGVAGAYVLASKLGERKKAFKPEGAEGSWGEGA